MKTEQIIYQFGGINTDFLPIFIKWGVIALVIVWFVVNLKDLIDRKGKPKKSKQEKADYSFTYTKEVDKK